MGDEEMTVRLLKRQLRREIQRSLKQLTDLEVIEECCYKYLRLADILSSEPLCNEIISTPAIQSISKCFHLSLYALGRTPNAFNIGKSFSVRLSASEKY
jgi:hypothetical protein